MSSCRMPSTTTQALQQISNTVKKKRADGKWQGQMPEGFQNHLLAGRLVLGKTLAAVATCSTGARGRQPRRPPREPAPHVPPPQVARREGPAGSCRTAPTAASMPRQARPATSRSTTIRQSTTIHLRARPATLQGPRPSGRTAHPTASTGPPVALRRHHHHRMRGRPDLFTVQQPYGRQVLVRALHASPQGEAHPGLSAQSHARGRHRGDPRGPAHAVARHRGHRRGSA